MNDDVISVSDSVSERGSVSPDLHTTFDNFEIDLPAVNFNYKSPEKNTAKDLPSDVARRINLLTESEEAEDADPVLQAVTKKTTKGEKRAAEVAQRKQEALEKRRRIGQEKLLKEVEKLNKKCQDKDELLRNCRAMMDEGLRDLGYVEAIAEEMREKKMVFSLANNPVPFSIIWQRSSVLHFVDEGELQSSTEVATENQMLVIWNWKEVLEMIRIGAFRENVEILHRTCKEKVTLLIVGTASSRKKGEKKEPEGSKRELEEQLVEIQVLYNCSSLFVQGAKEVAMTVCQFTKGIATIPLKHDSWKKLDDVETYVTGEKKSLVTVNKEGYGLKQLWQKQLCQFNLCSWEMAEVITIKYPSPTLLMKAYKDCSDSEGEMLLADLQVRRAAGPMSCARKIGPELSKKIYTMFTSTDGDKLLGNSSSD